MDTLVETIEDEGRVIEIHHDAFAHSPRDCQDNFATLVCGHRRYALPNEAGLDLDDFASWAEVESELGRLGHVVVVPVFLMDHSGLGVNTTGFRQWDPQGWDWGQIGFAACTAVDIRDNWSLPRKRRITEERLDDARRLVVAEVDEFGMYLSGQVFGYVVRDADGQDLDSCWGFYGHDAVLEAAKEAY